MDIFELLNDYRSSHLIVVCTIDSPLSANLAFSLAGQLEGRGFQVKVLSFSLITSEQNPPFFRHIDAEPVELINEKVFCLPIILTGSIARHLSVNSLCQSDRPEMSKNSPPNLCQDSLYQIPAALCQKIAGWLWQARDQISCSSLTFCPLIVSSVDIVSRYLCRLVARQLIDQGMQCLVAQQKSSDDAHFDLRIVERWAPVTTAILAAGKASRMGRPKQIEVVQGKPLVLHAIHAAHAGGANRILLITGAHVDQVKAMISASELSADTALTVIYNARWQEGQSTSVHAAVRWVQQHSTIGHPPLISSLILMPVDQPNLRPELLRILARKWQLGARIAVPSVSGHPRGAPALFDASLWPAMLKITGDVGAKELLRAHRNSLALVEVDHHQLIDVDTPDDLNRLSV